MSTQVETFQTNIDTVSDTFESALYVVDRSIAGLEITKQALRALNAIDTNAKALETLADGLGDALGLVKKLRFPGFSEVARALESAVKAVEKRAGQVSDAANSVEPDNDKNFDKLLKLVNVELALLKAEKVLLESSVKEYGSITDGLDDAVRVVSNTEGFDIPVELQAAIDAANATVTGINQGYEGYVGTINDVQALKDDVAAAIEPIFAPANAITGALNRITEITDSLSFLQGPVGVIQDILRPIQWALDVVGFIYDYTIGLVVNPIIKALGILDVFDGFVVDLIDLPSLAVFGNFENPLSDLADALNGDLIEDFKQKLQKMRDDISDDVVGSDLLGPVNDDPDDFGNLVIGDDDNPAPNDDPGTVLNAAGGADLVAGGLGDDTINGGDGNDLIIGGAGDDTIDGGAGVDGAVFFGSFADYRISYAGTDQDALVVTHVDYGGQANQGTDRLTNVEKIIFQDRTFDFDEFGNFTYPEIINGQSLVLGDGDPNFLFGDGAVNYIYGDNDDDYLFGGSGTDYLFGDAGDDIMDGGAGTSIFNGGEGEDTVTYEYLANSAGYSGSFIYAALDQAPTWWGSSDSFVSVENLTSGGGRAYFFGDAVENVLTGGDLADRMNGYGGDDAILTGAGDDYLVGGDGEDYLEGGQGDDTYIAGRGDDTYFDTDGGHLWYGGDRATDSLYTEPPNIFSGFGGVRLTRLGFEEQDFTSLIPQRIVLDVEAGTTEKFSLSGSSVGTDTFSGITKFTGSNGNDTFHGASTPHEINGGGGNDTFIGIDEEIGTEERTIWNGDAGDDTFTPGSGSYEIDGGDGADTLFVTSSEYVDFDGGSGDDTVDFSQSDRAWHFEPDSRAIEAEGFTPGALAYSIDDVEKVYGSQFADILHSGYGVEYVSGNAGNDVLVSANTGNSVTHILDGNDGDDTFYGASGDEFMRGGAGNDTFYTDSARNGDLMRLSAFKCPVRFRAVAS